MSLSNTDMISMIKKRIRERICDAIYQYEKANDRYMTENDKTKEFLYLKYCVVSNLYEWAILQKFPVNGFELVKNITKFDNSFTKS